MEVLPAMEKQKKSRPACFSQVSFWIPPVVQEMGEREKSRPAFLVVQDLEEMKKQSPDLHVSLCRFLRIVKQNKSGRLF